MKHILRYTVPALCTAILCLSSGVSASAYTADDVAAKARAAGWPETLIQAGYNEWNTGNYTQEQLDRAYNSVSQYDADTAEMVSDALGVDYIPPHGETAPNTPTNAQTDAPTNAVTDAPTSPAADPAPQNVTPETNAPAPTAAPVQPTQSAQPAQSTQPAQPAPAAPLTVTKTDGTTENRIDKAEFIKMPIEEKKAYVASLTEDSKKDFMDSLTTAERNSILKQLPADEKAALLQRYVDAAKDMGMNVAVDSIADDNTISMTIRNEGGQVIGKTAVGTIIDETGISHTGQLMTALLAALISVLGFTLMYRYLSRLD